MDLDSLHIRAVRLEQQLNKIEPLLAMLQTHADAGEQALGKIRQIAGFEPSKLERLFGLDVDKLERLASIDADELDGLLTDYRKLLAEKPVAEEKDSGMEGQQGSSQTDSSSQGAQQGEASQGQTQPQDAQQQQKQG